MVNTRSQTNRESRIEQAKLDRFADNDDNISVAGYYSASSFQENNEEAMKSNTKNTE